MSVLRPRALGLAAGLAALLLAGGCDHVTEPDGPNLIDRFGDFALLDSLTASQAAVDFAAGEVVTFEARFNKQVNWVIEITGDSSGAVKRLEGFSAEITPENARWSGGTTELPLFKDETVTAALFVPAEASDTSRTAVEVLTPRLYPGIVVADFEGGEPIVVTNPEFEFDFNGITAEVPPAQGDGFYLLRGTDDVVANNFFIGLITLRPADGDYFEVPTTVAEDLYFNCFLRGFGTPNTIAVVELEVEGVSAPVPLGTDVEFPNLGIVDFEGWQLYSEAATSFGQFGAGLTDEQVQRITGVRVVLISDNNNQTTPPNQVEYGIDYITFTAGGPLEL